MQSSWPCRVKKWLDDGGWPILRRLFFLLLANVLHPLDKPWSLVSITGIIKIKTYLPKIKRRVSRKSANLHHQAIFNTTRPHATRPFTQYFKKMKMEVLEWCGNSPDFNPTQNLQTRFFAKIILQKITFSYTYGFTTMK